MKSLVLLRHAESLWNRENRYTGWSDVPLTEKGRREAQEAGSILRKHDFHFDVAFTSVLDRATSTLDIVLETIGARRIPVLGSLALCERHYGALEGLSKAETVATYGAEQVRAWRRSYDVRPPALAEDDERYVSMRKNPRYQSHSVVPRTESLKDAMERLMPYWESVILPSLADSSQVLIVAHGNNIRGLVKHMEGM